MDLPKQYDSHKVEKKWLETWLKNHIGKSNVSNKKPYCIVIPPPNVTDILHMGHALNNTLQDVLIRYKRMKGYESLWLPGTDHAGIATQNVIEKIINKEGKSRHDYGREKFVELVWNWKKEKGGTIIKQLQELGCQCDWDRERFTMDEGLSDAVSEVFIRLYNEGLIYQGEYIVNWCPRCTSAIANLEVEYEETLVDLTYIKYPIKDGTGFVTVATTRPETMLGDVAVAFNPKDERYKHLKGKKIMLPLIGRELDVIYDDYVEMEFGTGAVKITPAHDPNDFEIGLRHNLKPVNILNPEGILNENAGQRYTGLDRFDARKKVLNDLQELGLIEKVEDYKTSIGHCYRCNSIVEPWLSRQWFVKMEPLAAEAIKVVREGKIVFYPERWTKVYLNWMENIRDWCISRQLWWGHRIPVYYCDDCNEIFVSKKKPKGCLKCGSLNIRQDEDVLDTWFSSWLWPFSTFGWPSENETTRNELSYYYPTDSLITACEIIFFWVARMIMAGLHFVKDIPFKEVHIHGTVRDEKHRKMSKSLGNGIDPLEIIEAYGADALRYAILLNVSQGQDVIMDTRSREAKLENFTVGRNFCNKLYNAARFLLMKCEGVSIITEESGYTRNEEGDLVNDNRKLIEFINNADQKGFLKLPDKWILSVLSSSINEIGRGLKSYRYDDALRIISQDFFWHSLCDWYIEIVKFRMSDAENDEEKVFLKKFLTILLENTLRALHPFIPFITEEIWHNLPIENRPEIKPGLSSITYIPFPCFGNETRYDTAENDWSTIQELIILIRNLKAEVGLEGKKDLSVIIKYQEEKEGKLIKDNMHLIKDIVQISELNADKSPILPNVYIADVSVNGKMEVIVLIEGKIDIEKEKTRLQKELERTGNLLQKTEKTLLNEAFLKNARDEVIDREKKLKIEFNDRLLKIRKLLLHL
ncbi:MAG: valine--tRNA ligase [Candidatus Coatesbacteria bacterium]|nr:valine--tRNA ligase [Candidatus Coatesbacteria bacterium]